MTTGTDASERAGLAPGTRILLTIAAAVVVLVGVWLARELLAPAAVAAVIVIIAQPVRRPIERRGWPNWVATAAVAVVAYLSLAAMLAMFVVASVQFARLVPQYADELEQTAQAVASALEQAGLTDTAADAASAVLDPGTLLEFATALASSIAGFATAFFFVLAYVVFMAADAGRLAKAGVAVFGGRAADGHAARYFSGVRRYYVVNAAFGLVVAVLDGLLLWALGIPAPLVWAILAFVTNFIPNIGFVIGLIPPALFALVIGGWPLMLLVIAAYCVINLVLQEFVQPKFVSDAVSLSLTLTFFSVVFWAFVIGPVGAILCIPLTLLVRALLIDPYPEMRTLARLSGAEHHAGRSTTRTRAGEASRAE